MSLQPLRRVLVVEDEADLREALLEVIGEAGFTAIGAADLERARSAVGGADIIVLDLVIDGATTELFLDELCAEKRRVILTTADASQRIREVAARCSVPLLLKPFDVEHLLAMLATV